MLADTDEADWGMTICPGFFFSRLSISRMCRIPRRAVFCFFVGDGIAPFMDTDSSLGSVTVLFIASPHRQLRLISSSGMLGSRDIVADGSVLLSISRNSRSCRWLRSCRPVDARHCVGGGLARGGEVGPGVAEPTAGLGSSPASVIARLRLFRPSMVELGTAGADWLDGGGDVG